MIFNITYTVGRIKVTDTVTCDTVGELSNVIKLILNENNLSLEQITIR
jgi:hypothetical protein